MNSPVQKLQELAQSHLRAGRKQEAKTAYEQIHRQFPGYAPAALMLGMLSNDLGNPAAAIDYLNKAIAIDREFAEAYFQIGFVLQQHRNFSGAIAAYHKLLELRPNDGKAMNNLGRALMDNGQKEEALPMLRLAVATTPKNAGAHSNLGDWFRLAGDLDQAMLHYRNAIAADGNCAEAFGNLGVVQVEKNELTQGIAMLRKALSINPRMFNPRFNLARVYQDAGKLDEAVAECQLAIDVRPGSGEAHNMMGNLLGIMGEIPTCVTAQKRAVELEPTNAGNHGNLLLSLQYRDDISQAERFAAHRRWNDQHIGATPAARPTEFDGNRRLRIGYVSPNFQAHSVAYFFEPVLAQHHREQFEIFCYSNTKNPDESTARIQKMCEHWRDIVGVSDADAAAMVRADGIDVLVDLTGHTAHNRLPMFGLRPAPVQISWIGYPDTTGMTAMDYRVTDAIADPPGESELLHTEKLVRIAGGCWAYVGPGVGADVAPPPSVKNGSVTFGSFNNLPKVTPAVMAVWARILRGVPGSRLVLKAAGLDGKIGRDYVSRHFTEHGIEPRRIEILSWVGTTGSHLDLYGRVDIALDTFPYNGTTTTCEALWMGLPVITLTGNRHVARVGTSLLTHGGCAEWIASDIESYIAKATAMAEDFSSLVEIRRGLRERIRHSDLGNPMRVARELENLYLTTGSKQN